MPRVRIHQHVNPLAPYYRQPPEPVVLAEAFADPELPLLLDVGCGRGRFLLRMAAIDSGWNYLGVEIRESLVEEANRIAADEGYANLHYTFCNAMLWLERLLADIPEGRLQMVTIQFPDPWFKKKHAKRRMVNGELIRAVTDKLAPGGRIFIQTDIEFLIEEMLELCRENAALSQLKIDKNPFPIKTEREKAVEDKNLSVYRTTWQKYGR